MMLTQETKAQVYPNISRENYIYKKKKKIMWAIINNEIKL